MFQTYTSVKILLLLMLLLLIMSESVPLLRSSSVTSHKRRCSSCPFSYRFQFIHSRGAILVLIWDLMIGICMNMLTNIVIYKAAYNEILDATLAFTTILAAFFGDFLISRYKLVLVGTYASFFLLIPLMIIETLMSQIPLLVFYGFLFFIRNTIIIARVNLIPFNIDQLIGSSSDELTAVIHWHNVGPVVALFFGKMISLETNNLLVSLLCYSVCIISVTAVLVSHNLFNHYLDTTPVNTSNPIKLIVRVLCYARKHKYPENRSALTYWEEEAPSRLDLGKEKYGGPFTEEQVEDVKTILRLIPLVFVCTLATGFYQVYVEGFKGDVYGCHIKFNGFLMSSVYVFIILLHQFLIYPCFRKYIPSMLKKIGLGIVLIVIVNTIYTVLAVTGYYHVGEMFHCLTAFDEKSYNASEHTWLISHNFILAVIMYVINVVLVEFILAQCPKSMRGTMIGLWLCFRELRINMMYVLFLPFHHYMSLSFPFGRGFYFFLTQTLFSFVLLLIFIFLAKRYKFRVREVEINIHRIAENHTINNIEQENEYWRRRNETMSQSSSSSDNTQLLISN